MMNEVSALSLNLLDRTSSTIYVSNIRHTTPVSSISTIFSKYGPLERCEIPENKFGKTRGFAFIEFENKSHAFTAFDELSKQEILLDGRILKLEWARATKLYKEDIQSLSTESKEKIMGNFSRGHSFDSKYAKNKRKGIPNKRTTGMYSGNSPNVYDMSKPKPFNPTVAQPLMKKDLDYSNGNINPSYNHVNPSLSINSNNGNIAKKNVNLIVSGQNYDSKLVVNGTVMVPNSHLGSNNYIGSGNLNSNSSPSNMINGTVGIKSFNDAPLNANNGNINTNPNNPNTTNGNSIAQNSPNTSPSLNNNNSVNDNENNANNIFTSYFGGSNMNNNFDFNLQSTINSIANIDLRANEVNLVKPSPYNVPINVHSSTNYPNSYLNEDFNPDTQSYNNFTSNILSNPSNYHYFNNQDPVYVNNPTNSSFSHFSNNFTSNFGGFNSYFNSNFN